MDIKLWREILHPYEMAVDELTLKFNNIIKEYRTLGEYSPIEMVDGRVKKISSILEKCQKKGILLEEVCEKVDDIAGIRIICQFVEDIYKVVELINSRTDIRVVERKDYITNMKASGYRSYHMVIEYTIQTMKGPNVVKAEIQIRTLAMNFWATIEHSLQYKYRRNMPPHIRERLSAASAAIINLDAEMSRIRDEIMDSQNSFRIKANIITEILNLIQNLYKVANKREIIKIQDEFYRVYSHDDIIELEHFLTELDVLAEGYRAQGIEDQLI
ncbi:MAG: GTP pyrophosphokinase family protein [Clostridiales bacterium]|nr:GTP pyrophosphokinase family protein [Clostridiales bacterium]